MWFWNFDAQCDADPLEVQDKRRVHGDFEDLVGMLYRDDDDGLLYVMQSVTTQREGGLGY